MNKNAKSSSRPEEIQRELSLEEFPKRSQTIDCVLACTHVREFLVDTKIDTKRERESFSIDNTPAHARSYHNWKSFVIAADWRIYICAPPE